MSNKHAAAYHDGNQACACGSTHTSVLAAIYCAEAIETETAEAARKPKPHRPSPFIRAYD